MDEGHYSASDEGMMFCPQCGTQNEDRAKFCIGCGKTTETKPPAQVTIIKREFPFQPKPFLIFIGIALITSLYIFPVHQLQYFNSQTVTVTTATAVSTCSSLGWTCSPFINIGFCLFWLLGLGLIIYGIFQKKQTRLLNP